MFKAEEVLGQGFWLAPDRDKSNGGNREHYLHSDGRVLSTCEFFPNRKDAEAVLAEFPDAKIPAPQRKWRSGDVFRSPYRNGKLMVYIAGVRGVYDRVFCLNGSGCDMKHITVYFMPDAEFVFNVNDYLGDGK